jgi:hypothetical protein
LPFLLSPYIETEKVGDKQRRKKGKETPVNGGNCSGLQTRVIKRRESRDIEYAGKNASALPRKPSM